MTFHDRIESGTHWWAGELCFRAAGAVLLGSAIAVFHLMRGHPAAQAGEFALGAGFIAALWAGLALLICGPFLFKLQPLPVRAWLPVSGPRRSRTGSTERANKAQ